MVAELNTHPLGVGTSVSRYTSKAIQALSSIEGLRIQITPMSTVMEAENIDLILEGVRRVHQALIESGVQRISTILVIDDRRDKLRRMEDMVSSVSKAMENI